MRSTIKSRAAERYSDSTAFTQCADLVTLTFDLLTSKLICESRVAWAAFITDMSLYRKFPWVLWESYGNGKYYSGSVRMAKSVGMAWCE